MSTPPPEQVERVRRLAATLSGGAVLEVKLTLDGEPTISSPWFDPQVSFPYVMHVQGLAVPIPFSVPLASLDVMGILTTANTVERFARSNAEAAIIHTFNLLREADTLKITKGKPLRKTRAR